MILNLMKVSVILIAGLITLYSVLAIIEVNPTLAIILGLLIFLGIFKEK